LPSFETDDKMKWNNASRNVSIKVKYILFILPSQLWNSHIISRLFINH